jgi:hypothetical protein
MRQRANALLKRTPRTVLGFAALCLVLDVGWYVVYPGSIDAHLVLAAVEFPLSLALLAALVLCRRRWAWWLCVAGPVSWFVSPAWGYRFHPVTDLIEAALFVLLLTPAMRRHAGGVFGWRRPGPDSRWWSLKPWLWSLGLAAAITAFGFVGGRHRAIHSTSARDVDLALFGLVLAAGLRLLGFVAQLGRRLVGRQDATETPEP